MTKNEQLAFNELDKYFDGLHCHNGAWQTLKAHCTQPTDVQQPKPKMPRVEDIINDVVGNRKTSMHDVAVVAGINECYRYISRHFGH